MKISGHRFI